MKISETVYSQGISLCRMSLRTGAAVLGLLWMALMPSPLQAACLAALPVMNCDDSFVDPSLPLVYTADGDGVEQLNLLGTAPAFDAVSGGVIVQFFNNDNTANHPLQLDFQSGALITAGAPGVRNDAIHMRNQGTGALSAQISGTLNAVWRGLRMQPNQNASTDPNSIDVTATGSVVTGQTALWLRDQSQGASTIQIDGRVTSDTSRAIHLSNNNLADPSVTRIAVGTGGVVASGNQGIYLGSAGTGEAQIAVLGTVTGGVDNDAVNIFDDFSAALMLDLLSADGLIEIGATARVESLNDVAIVDTRRRATAGVGTTTINNAGELVGHVVLGEQAQVDDGADLFTNSGRFLVRDYADDDFDAGSVRETESTALNDFGAGADLFDNRGELVLASVDSATTPGQERAEFINLETFRHAGRISLADVDGGGAGPVAGDELYITASGTAGSNGGGQFVAEGGELALDVVLGDETSVADVLTLDDVVLGAAPVRVEVSNAAGAGAATAGDGIMVIRVLGDSPAAVFAMAPLTVGGFEYQLVQADGQNWFLQSREARTLAGAGASAQAIPVLPAPGLVLLLGFLLLIARRRLIAYTAHT